MEDKEKIKLDKEKILNNTLTATLTIVTSAIIIIAMFMIINNKNDTELSSNSRYIARIEEAMKKLDSKYIDIDNVDKEKLIDGAIAGMAAATNDPYTRFVSEEEFNEMLTSGEEEYGGIGVHITIDEKTNYIMVLGVMPNTPALESGIKSGDLITKVAGIDVNKETYQKCIDEMKGKPNTKIKITIKRNDKTFEKEVERKIIKSSNVESEILENNIGYIKIWAFENKVFEQFKSEYERLLSKNINGLVIDVRNNPGGIVPETIKILDLLLPKCDVLKLVYNDGKEKVYKCEDDKEINIPLVLLVNDRSASASEILASAIKDANKGKIIGIKTYGKGIVQEVSRLGQRGAMSITVAKYYTMGGKEIHKNGIEPDIIIDLPENLKNEIGIPKENDLQLKKALEFIKGNK